MLIKLSLRAVQQLTVCLTCGWLVAAGVHAESLGTIESEGIERTAEGVAAQERVDAVSDNTRSLVDDYRSELKLVEGLESYIGMLEEQLVGQAGEIETMQGAIGDVAVIERQILPLLSRMIETLEKFVAIDTPFLMNERSERVDDLRALLKRSDVTAAEKARRVFEAYQIENDYGRTIEAYRDKLTLGEGTFDADFLRIGRVALMYRTVGTQALGFWDAKAGSWRELDGSRFKRLIDNGLKVARQEKAPELVFIPLATDQVESL